MNWKVQTKKKDHNQAQNVPLQEFYSSASYKSIFEQYDNIKTNHLISENLYG